VLGKFIKKNLDQKLMYLLMEINFVIFNIVLISCIDNAKVKHSGKSVSAHIKDF